MGRACVCCGDECLNDVIHINVDRYAPGIRSFVETITEIYQVKVRTNSFFNAPTSIELVSSNTERSIDNSPFVSNTFRTEKVSSETISEDGKRLTLETWEKITVVRKLALSFNIDDVFDWEEENKYGIKFIDSVYFRLGGSVKKDMSGQRDWAASSKSDETTTSVFSGIIYGQDLPADISGFDSLFSDGEYKFDIIGMSKHAAVDIDDFFERGNTKYLILLQPQDKELKDGFLDQEPNEDGEYKKLSETTSDKKPGSLVGLGRWIRDGVEQKIWLELIRPGSRGAATSQFFMDSEVQYWLNDTGNIFYDWHDCFKRIANGEYESTCKYMDTYFDFGVFDDIYFKEGSKLEIELFKAKTDNTKGGARKTEALLLYELVVGDNVIRENPNTGFGLQHYRFEDVIEYRFFTGESVVCGAESLPISEWVNWKTAKIEEDCTKELVGEIPELTPCNNINQHNFYKVKDKELFEWDLKYSIDGEKDLIMTKYTNPCDSLESESQIGCDGLNNCSFVENNPVTDRVGPIFIRDCVIETTPGYYIEDGYTHRYEAKHPIHGSYEPLNVRLQLIDHQYYPNTYLNSFGGISIQEVQNTRTGNNLGCPVVECLGGPAVLEWELVDEEFIDLSNSVTFEPHDTTIYDKGCHTRIISSKKRKENVGGNIDRVITASTNTTKYVPSSEEFYIIAGMDTSSSYCRLNSSDLLGDIYHPAWFYSGPIAYGFATSIYGGETTRVCDTTISYGIGFGGGSFDTNMPCSGYGGSSVSTPVFGANYCDSGPFEDVVTTFQAGEFYSLWNVGFILGPKAGSYITENFYNTIEPDVTRRFIEDQFMYEDYTLEGHENITDWDNNLEMATVHDIVVIEEPYFLVDDFDAFYSTYDRDVRDIVLGQSRENGNLVPDGQYIVGEGVRFRIQESFLNCQREQDEEGNVVALRSTFSDFDPLYQFYTPVITQDAQLDEDQIGEIAGYLTDFDYWYQIKGTFFIEDEEGVDLSEDDEGNIIVGTYVTDKWFYIDGAGNINGPFDSSGFVETLPDFAVYDKVDIYWDGLQGVVVDIYGAGLESGEAYALSGEDHRCTTNVFGSSFAYDSQFPSEIVTDCFLPKIDVSAPDLRLKNDLCAVSPFDTCQYPVPVNHRKIADAWFTSPPERVESTATISRTYTGDTALPLPQDIVSWNYQEAGDRCSYDACLGYCPITNIYGTIPNSCLRTLGVWKEDPTIGYEPLDFGESININFEIPVRGLNVPTEEFDYTYSKGDSVSASEGITEVTTGFLVPQASGVHFYKKTVPRFSCDNLPEITFTGDDLLFKCREIGVGGGEVFNIWGSVIADLPYVGLPVINVLKNARWDLTEKYEIPKARNREGRIYNWDSVISELEEILSSVEWDALTNVSRSFYDRGDYCQTDTPTPFTIFETHDGCFGPVRQTENPNDYGTTSFQIESYGIDNTYREAYYRYIELLEKYNLEDFTQDFTKLVASYQSGYDFCYWERSLALNSITFLDGDGLPASNVLSARFGYDPPDWAESCPHIRPSKNLPGAEYDKWGPDSLYVFSEACGEDRGGVFKYDSCTMPNAAGPWRSRPFGTLGGIYCDNDNDCTTDYTQLNKYEETENENYTFTIKGKNSVEE